MLQMHREGAKDHGFGRLIQVRKMRSHLDHMAK